MSPNNYRELLTSNPDTVRWVEYLDAVEIPNFSIRLPTIIELPQVLLRLTVPHEDIDTLVSLLPELEASAGLRWLLERCACSLIGEMGNINGPPSFPVLPEGFGLFQRYFYIFVFVAVLPYVQAYHRERSIPDDVAWHTLADLGRNMAVYRKRYGVGGLHTAPWLMLHFRGALYDLGRLQFQRAQLGTRTGEAIAAAGLPYRPGSFSLGVHIPEFYGPLAPAACDAAFARAREFFPRYYPQEPYEIATCHSWLLDNQLAEYLPAESNIIRFQNRFTPAYLPDDNDETILRFVFGFVPASLDELPQRTQLERAIVAHMQAGRHWRGGAGWVRL